MEGYIRKINRHKRKAWVSIEMFGRSVDMEVGLEIISKVTHEEFTDEKENKTTKMLTHDIPLRLIKITEYHLSYDSFCLLLVRILFRTDAGQLL